ncbi:MAG: serine--tRNA ligase, partial [Planctomycetota bacterium]|nr:serine--tRNA ligase [Planctomycetota bacterium]
SKSIGRATNDTEREQRMEEGRRLRAAKDAAQQGHDLLEVAVLETQRRIPNLSHPDVPVGRDDNANLEVRRGQHEIRSFEFVPRDHLQIGDHLDLFDFEAASRVSGHGFYYFRNDAVLLELALQRYALDIAATAGFTLTTTPDLARNEILEGIGFNPRGDETQIYSVVGTDLSLVATAEITLGGYLAGQTLAVEQLPIRLAGISHCFRTEAGAHGRETRGLYRVHQFTKVEMFVFCEPEQSDAMLEEICGLQCQVFDGLEIPYRVVDTATGDLGGPAYRKYDLEAWMPGRGDGGTWGEVTSTSNCTDYQARRLQIRFKKPGEKGTQFVHTLNGTAVAISRAMIALVENHQQSDGSILIPEKLRPYLGKDRIVPK